MTDIDYFTWVANSRIDGRLEICKWVGNVIWELMIPIPIENFMSHE